MGREHREEPGGRDCQCAPGLEDSTERAPERLSERPHARPAGRFSQSMGGKVNAPPSIVRQRHFYSYVRRALTCQPAAPGDCSLDYPSESEIPGSTTGSGPLIAIPPRLGAWKRFPGPPSGPTTESHSVYPYSPRVNPCKRTSCSPAVRRLHRDRTKDMRTTTKAAHPTRSLLGVQLRPTRRAPIAEVSEAGSLCGRIIG